METPCIPIALIYDFDGTLISGNMQEHSLLPALGYETASVFWDKVKNENKKTDGDEVLTYMRLLIAGRELSKQDLENHGKDLPMFPGVEDWFKRINSYAKDRNLVLEHYVISSGLREMIEGSSLKNNFKNIFASRYMYEDGIAKWPAVAINYTTKTQYLFRINKGINNNWNDAAVNKYIPEKEREIPFERMIFFGDGDTDIPTMKMLKYQGGTAIAVFDEKAFKNNHQKKVYKLIAEERANYVCPANYENGSLLDITVKGMLGRIAREHGYRPSTNEGE